MSVRFWNPETGEQIGDTIVQSSQVTSVTYRPGRDYVITGASDGAVNWWEFDGGNLASITFPRGVYSVSVSSDDQRFLVGTGTSLLVIPPRPEVYVYDLQVGGPPLLTFGSEANDAFYRSVVRSPAEDLILTAVSGVLFGSSRLWSGATGQLVRELDGGRVADAAFSHDGRYALTAPLAFIGHPANLWDVESAKTEEDPEPIRVFEGHSQDVTSVAFSPDDTMVLTGSMDGTVRLWWTENGAVNRSFEIARGGNNSVAFSPSGGLIAAGTSDGTIWLQEVEVVCDDSVDNDFDGRVDYRDSDCAEPIEYAALGDSYSSGEGVPWYFDGTDEGNEDDPDRNLCHRSELAYPTMIRAWAYPDTIFEMSDPETGTPGFGWDFLACSGAKTENVKSGGLAQGKAPSEIAQLDQASGSPPVNVVKADTDLVTITIGGNDAGFADVVTACFVEDDCHLQKVYLPNSTDTRQDRLHAFIDGEAGLRGRLRQLYGEIRSATEENATVLVLEYPQIVSGQECPDLQLLDSCRR